MGHALYAPSAADIWLTCTASVGASRGCPDYESSYAAEGSYAHDCAAKILCGLMRLEDVEGQELQLAVEEYVDHCHSLPVWTDCQNVEVYLRSRALPQHGGTIDWWAVSKDEPRLVYIRDFKAGAGIPVDAASSNQLRCYAALHAENFPQFDLYDVGIVQPRSHYKTFTNVVLRREELTDFQEYAFERMVAPPEFNAGKHCRFCPALVTCPLLKSARDQVMSAIENLTPETEIIELLRWMEVLPAMRVLCSRVEELLVGHMRNGRTIPGYKAVETFKNRQWKGSEEQIIRLLQSLNRKELEEKDVYEKRLKTPKQIEDQGLSTDGLTVRRHSSYTLKPVTDPGDPATFVPAATIFEQADQREQAAALPTAESFR